MKGTARLMLSQKEHDIYTIAAIAEVLGKPRILGGQWLFEHTVIDSDSFDAISDDEESDTLRSWFDNESKDLVDLLGEELGESIEEEIEFEYELTEYEVAERRAYERDLCRGRMLV